LAELIKLYCVEKGEEGFKERHYLLSTNFTIILDHKLDAPCVSKGKSMITSSMESKYSNTSPCTGVESIYQRCETHYSSLQQYFNCSRDNKSTL